MKTYCFPLVHVMASLLHPRYIKQARINPVVTLLMNDIHLVAKEIEYYLARHPHAADSIEGIVKWWLPQQRYVDAHDKIVKALDYLIAQGVVKKIDIPGSSLYSHKESADVEQGEKTNQLAKG